MPYFLPVPIKGVVIEIDDVMKGLQEFDTVYKVLEPHEVYKYPRKKPDGSIEEVEVHIQVFKRKDTTIRWKYSGEDEWREDKAIRFIAIPVANEELVKKLLDQPKKVKLPKGKSLREFIKEL